jgi:hypothetical protein
MFFGIRDPGSEIRDPGWEKTRIRDKHPGSATLERKNKNGSKPNRVGKSFKGTNSTGPIICNNC